MKRLSHLTMVSLSCLVLVSCRDVSLEIDGVDAGSGAGGGGANTGGATGTGGVTGAGGVAGTGGAGAG
ncbi:MAG TPA: hypothetical protein VJ860_05315, partial [Polyangia bacterium]|nr:hypothetical protein [Polyangia bacterium]